LATPNSKKSSLNPKREAGTQMDIKVLDRDEEPTCEHWMFGVHTFLKKPSNPLTDHLHSSPQQHSQTHTHTTLTVQQNGPSFSVFSK
jgi:hypothetical protein